jgi:hypothetical protein
VRKLILYNFGASFDKNMVCFTNYALTVPKNDSVYVEHVLRKIYGFGDGDLSFLKGTSNNLVKIVKETETTIEIQFRICVFTALVNVLPSIVVNSNRKFFKNEIFYKQAVSLLQDEVRSVSDDLAVLPPKMYLDEREVYPLVLQFAVDNLIQKFVALDGNGRYICVVSEVPLFVGTVKGTFQIHVLSNIIFDVDDGFIGDGVTNLNTVFGGWKGKWTESLLPVVTVTDDAIPEGGVKFEIGRGYRPPEINNETCFKRTPVPKIMEEMASMLKAKGHQCVMIEGMTDHKFHWCGLDDCPKTKMYEDMHRRQKEQEALVDRLREEGHRCISIAESYPMQVMWCHQTPCTGPEKHECSEPACDLMDCDSSSEDEDVFADMDQRDSEQKAFADRLVSEGHKCVTIAESYPCRVSWCESTVCKES